MASIPAIIEDTFKQTIWFNEMSKAFSKKPIRPITKNSVKAIEKNSVVLIIGISNDFIDDCVQLCNKNSIRCIVVGATATEYNSLVSCVTINRKSATSSIVSYLKELNSKRIALLGINTKSVVDVEKKQGFIDMVTLLYGHKPHNDIFTYKDSAEETINLLLKSINSYDAIICSNDYFAIQLINALQNIGLNVPDDIKIVGYGNSAIGAMFNPSITTFAFDYKKIGSSSIKLYEFLSKNPDITNCNISLDGNIIPRKTTNNYSAKTITSLNFDVPFDDSQSIFNDLPLKQILMIDEILTSDDRLNTKIILEILKNSTNAQMSDTLFLSNTALNHRIKKIYKHTGTNSKKELYNLLINIFNKNGDKIE